MSEFKTPLSRTEAILQNILGDVNKLGTPLSRIEKLLMAILNKTDYTDNILSQAEEILYAILKDGEWNKTPKSRSEKILKSILDGEEYTSEIDEESRIEVLLREWSKGTGPKYVIRTVTGAIVKILDALAEPAVSLKVFLEPKQEGTPWMDAPTTEPYLTRAITRGTSESYSLVGGTVAWNQLVNNIKTAGLVNGLTRSDASHDDIKAVRVFGECTVGTNYNVFSTDRTIENRVCLITLGNVELPTGSRLSLSAKDKTTTVIYKTTTPMSSFVLYIANGVSIDVTIYPQVIDLTQMFGTTIADYAYSLEQSQAGSGIAWLKSYGFFTEDYYPYNPGELISVNTSGHKIGSTTYPIQSTDLRGLFKLDSANKLTCEGDIYTPSGNVSRKYTILNLGESTWTRNNAGQFYSVTAPLYLKAQTTNMLLSNGKYTISATGAYSPMVDGCISARTNGLWITDSSFASGTELKASLADVYLLIELDESTTESATPYTSPIDVEAGGTEEFVDNRTVPIPVGNSTVISQAYPITGWDGVSVTRSGKNLFDLETISNILVSPESDLHRNGTFFRQSGTYTVSAQTFGDYLYCRVFNADDSIKQTYNVVSSTTITNAAFTISGGEYFAVYDAVNSTISASKERFQNWKCQVELGSTATDYEPYKQTDTYSVSFESQGTVYGGYVDVVSGVLTVTHAEFQGLENLNWEYAGAPDLKAFISPKNVIDFKNFPYEQPNFVCSHYSYKVSNQTKTEGIELWSYTKQIVIRDERFDYNTTADFKASLADVQLVYELAEPQTYQLTPQEVQMLLGSNTVWSDGGDIELSYKAPNVSLQVMNTRKKLMTIKKGLKL